MSGQAPLLPREDARDAALFFVVSALCFLAALAGLSARAAYSAADNWTDRVTGQITIRVRGDEADVARAERLVKDAQGVASARALSRSETESLLAPWLGSAGVPPDLPLPSLIAAEALPDVTGVPARLADALSAANIDATVDDHLAWSEDVRRATGSGRLVALSAVALLSATAIAVIAFATHAALVARRDIVEVLHLSGARDSFIAKLFEQRFMALGLQAGCVGAVLALGAAAFILFAAKQSDESVWLLPQMSLSLADGLILGLTPLVAGAAATMAARVTVL
ncbi:MAG: cell division protein FtsX, partial [Pseudomonadota bacterium]